MFRTATNTTDDGLAAMHRKPRNLSAAADAESTMSSFPPAQPGASPSFHAGRRLFPGAERHIYMDTAARGLIASPTRAAVDRFLDERMHGEADKDGMFRTVERARELFARLVGASPDEVALVKNVSEGLNAVATALPWCPGDNLVMCPEVEHPNAVYVALN